MHFLPPSLSLSLSLCLVSRAARGAKGGGRRGEKWESPRRAATSPSDFSFFSFFFFPIRCPRSSTHVSLVVYRGAVGARRGATTTTTIGRRKNALLVAPQRGIIFSSSPGASSLSSASRTAGTRWIMQSRLTRSTLAPRNPLARTLPSIIDRRSSVLVAAALPVAGATLRSQGGRDC